MTERIPSISPQGLHGRMGAGQSVTLLDVRSPAEYRAGHIKGALSLPLDELDSDSLAQRLGVPGIGKDVPLYLTCQSGARAEQAAEKLSDTGHRNLMLLRGGTEEWRRKGLPMRGTPGALSLEQQVQVTIGALLILKVVFGFTVNELFFVFGALIGAGLITAGLTRWCGLARLLALMPWNRGRTEPDQATR
jgi:rhodanese-related sulfurtransferase